MKKIVYSMFLVMSFSLFAGVDPEVFIRGEISGIFNDKEVRVTDNLGQKYYLPRSAFPSDFEIKQGKKFAINVSDKIIQKIKMIK